MATSRKHLLAMGLLTGTVSLGLGIWGQATGRPWQTMIFTSLALLQLGNALAVRSERQSVFRLGLGSNRFLGWTVLCTLLVQLGLLYWPPTQTASVTSRAADRSTAMAGLSRQPRCTAPQAIRELTPRRDRQQHG